MFLDRHFFLLFMVAFIGASSSAKEIDSFDIRQEGDAFKIIYRLDRGDQRSTVHIHDSYGYASMAALYSAWSAYRSQFKDALQKKSKEKSEYEKALQAFYKLPFGNPQLITLIDKIWGRQIESLKKTLPTSDSEERKSRITEHIQDLEKARKRLAEKGSQITREEFDTAFSNTVTISYEYLALPLKYEMFEGDKLKETGIDYPILDSYTTADFKDEPKKRETAIKTYNLLHKKNITDLKDLRHNGFSIFRHVDELSGEVLPRGIVPILGWDGFVGRVGRLDGGDPSRPDGGHRVPPPVERPAKKTPF